MTELIDNFIKNIMVCDSIAQKIFNDYIANKTLLNTMSGRPNMYYLIGSNIIIATMLDKKNIFEYRGSQTIVLKNLLQCIEDILNNKTKLTSYKNICSFKTIKKSLIDNLENINYKNGFLEDEANKYIDFYKNKIYKTDFNDTLFLELALAISLFHSNIDSLIENLVEIIKELSTSTIKILSFISIGIFAFFAKKYAFTKDESYEPKKWMNILVDMFMDKTIDKYITIDLDSIEKKKFIFMIIKYISSTNHNNDDYPHQRIRDLNDCFCIPIEKLEKYIPGYSADQSFILSYDFFLEINNWLNLITYNCLTYTEIKHINIISSWYYLLINNNLNIYNQYNLLKNDMNINNLINLIKINIII
jgi:hypothetical protein